jgi:COMPASS component SWD1
VASISQGVVTLWAQQQVENWSAFAPDFKELDENVDYEERESEFDIEDEDKSVQLNEEEKADDIVDIDVDKNAPIPAFCSSDEEGEDKNAVLYLPIAPEIEDPEDNWVPGVDPPPTSDESAPHKRGASADASKENTSPKKKRPKTIDIALENAPSDGNNFSL